MGYPLILLVEMPKQVEVYNIAKGIGKPKYCYRKSKKIDNEGVR